MATPGTDQPHFLFFLEIFGLMVLLGFTHGQSADKNASCDQWADIAQKLSLPGKMENCSVRADDCRRMDCSGSASFSRNLLPDILTEDISINYCLGTLFNSCKEPLSLDFYLQVPSKNISHSYRIVKDDAYPMTDMSVPLGSLGTAYPVFNVEFERQNSTAVLFSVTALVKIHTQFMDYEDKNLRFRLIDKQVVQVTPCQKIEKDPSPKPAADFAPNKCQLRQADIVPTIAPPPVYAVSATLNKPCELTTGVCGHGEMCSLHTQTNKCICHPDFDLSPKGDACLPSRRINQACISTSQCGFNEECKYSSSKMGTCQCKQRYSYNPARDMCLLRQSQDGSTGKPPELPQTSPQPKVSEAKTVTPTEKHNLPMIVGGGLATAVAVGLIMWGLMFYIRRRKKQQLSINDSESTAPLIGNGDSDNLVM